MNERKHWNKIGSNYQDEIFDVFASDRKKLLPKLISKYADKNHAAIDFGCGIGRAFKYIAPKFKSVLALDISDSLLDIARNSPYPNITYKQHDLTKSLRAKADFGFCVNVVMLPEPDQNRQMLKNIRNTLRPGGNLVIVLPSLDSFIYSGWQLIEWCKREGTKPQDIDSSELSGFKGTITDIVQGIVKIDGVKTKHYSEPELHVLFRQVGFNSISVNRLEYDWTSEFSEPPKWMGEPYPWDWVVEAKA
jgi:SAM-dependent methyltransferase